MGGGGVKCERGVSYKPEKAMVGGRSGEGIQEGIKVTCNTSCVCVHTLHPTKCMKKRLLHFIIACTLGILPQR